MDLSVHFIASLILSVILFPYFQFLSLLVFISGFLIDADHVLFYYIRYGPDSLKNIYRFYKTADNRRYKDIIRPFHSIEVLILIVLLSFFHPIFMILLIGLLLHLLLDMIYELRKFGSLKNYSLLIYIKDQVRGRE